MASCYSERRSYCILVLGLFMYISLLSAYLVSKPVGRASCRIGEAAAKVSLQASSWSGRLPIPTRLRQAWLSLRSPKFMMVGLAALLQRLTAVLRAFFPRRRDAACLWPELLLHSLDPEQAVPELNWSALRLIKSNRSPAAWDYLAKRIWLFPACCNTEVLISPCSATENVVLT